MGRQKGSSVLKLLCRMSLEPDSCVSTTRYWFRRLGGWAMIVVVLIDLRVAEEMDDKLPGAI